MDMLIVDLQITVFWEWNKYADTDGTKVSSFIYCPLMSSLLKDYLKKRITRQLGILELINIV